MEDWNFVSNNKQKVKLRWQDQSNNMLVRWMRKNIQLHARICRNSSSAHPIYSHALLDKFLPPSQPLPTVTISQTFVIRIKLLSKAIFLCESCKPISICITSAGMLLLCVKQSLI